LLWSKWFNEHTFTTVLTFLLHKKFWLPILLLVMLTVAVELVLRSGIYNRWVQPNTLLGHSIHQIKALERFGNTRVHWLTLGDSKVDWGINHRKLKSWQRAKGINHLRLSMPGSNFMTYQTASEWSMDEYPNLQGIFFGLYENELVTHSNPNKEFSITWPFKKYLNFDRFNYFHHTNLANHWFKLTAIYHYLPDIKAFIADLQQRQHLINEASTDWQQAINFNHSVSRDMCEYNLSDLTACIKTAQRLSGLKSLPRGTKTPYRKCSTEQASARVKNQQWRPEAIDLQPHFEQWQYLFNEILKRDKHVILALLPEHPFFGYMSKPSNTNQLVDQLNTSFADHPKFRIIDLRDLFNDQNACEFFTDTIHFNRKGNNRVTAAIIDRLSTN